MIGLRFKKFRQALDLSQTEIANTLQVKPSAVSQYESGKIYPSNENLDKISKAYGVNLHWLLTGEGTMFTGKLGDYSSRLDKYASVQRDDSGILQVVTLPVLAEISAGKPVEAIEGEPLDYIAFHPSLIPNEKDFFCFRVNGDSMEPIIMDGDLVAIRRSVNWKSLQNKVCAMRLNGEITLKRLLKSKSSPHYILEAENKRYEPIIVEPEQADLTLVGEMVYLFRKMH